MSCLLPLDEGMWELGGDVGMDLLGGMPMDEGGARDYKSRAIYNPVRYLPVRFPSMGALPTCTSSSLSNRIIDPYKPETRKNNVSTTNKRPIP